MILLFLHKVLSCNVPLFSVKQTKHHNHHQVDSALVVTPASPVLVETNLKCRSPPSDPFYPPPTVSPSI